MSTSTHLITAEELFWMPDDEKRHELVRGQLIALPWHGLLHAFVVTNILVLLDQAVRSQKLGKVLPSTGFILAKNPDTVLAPDVAFIRKERTGRMPRHYFDGAPDLAVEVLDPLSFGLVEDSSRWLPFGTAMVWIVDPETESVEVSLANGDRQLLTLDDDLTGGDLIPGFCIPVSEIFAD